MPREIPLQRVRRRRRLMDQGRALGQELGEQRRHDLIVGAAQDRLVRMPPDPPPQRIDVIADHDPQFLDRRPQFDQPGQPRTGLRERRQVLAPLLDLDLIDLAHRRRGRAEDPQDLQLLDLAVRRRPLIPAAPRRRLDSRHDDAQHVQPAPGLLAVFRQPHLLQPPQRDRRGRVAGQDHDIRPRLEQPHAPGLRQLDDLLARQPAVRRIGLVGQIDDVRLGEPVHQPAMHGQPAHPGIENANRHGAGL